MTCDEFDFYAQSVVEREGLVIDTLLMGLQIYEYNDVVRYKDGQIGNLENISHQKDTIILKYHESFGKLSKDYQKSEKKVKRNRTIALALAGISAVLCIIVLLK